MSMEDFFVFPMEGDHDVARAKSSKPSINTALVDKYVRELTAAGTSQSAFGAVVSSMTTDADLNSAEIVAIANRYAVAGTRATSKPTALSRIKKRFVELVRSEGNARVAAKARPW
jgi:hypothetical protein